MSKICTILVGLPGVGKSYYLNTYTPAPNVASSDAIIEKIANQRNSTYSAIFSEVIAEADKQFWDKIKSFCESGESFAVDRTNLTVKSRARIISLVKQYGYVVEALVFETPDQEEWERRLNSRVGKVIPKHVLETMQTSFTMPEYAEGFSRIAKVGQNATS